MEDQQEDTNEVMTNPDAEYGGDDASSFFSGNVNTGHSQLQAYGDEGFEFPPGFRFEPHDYELVVDYLKPKILNLYVSPKVIQEVELYKFNPDQLAAMFEPHKGRVWYFFTPRERKYRNGLRPNRAAGQGFWKATGADKEIMYLNSKVGYRKALVFYMGKAPKGEKTDWIMHEYRLVEAPKRERAGDDDMRLDDWVLCRIYKKADKSSRGRTRAREVSDDEIEESVNIHQHHVSAVEYKVLPDEIEESVNTHQHYVSAVEYKVLPDEIEESVNTHQQHVSAVEYKVLPEESDSMRYRQSPRSMHRDRDGIILVENEVLPKETSMNCSLRGTGMPYSPTVHTSMNFTPTVHTSMNCSLQAPPSMNHSLQVTEMPQLNCQSLPAVPTSMNCSNLHQVSEMPHLNCQNGMPHLNCQSLSAVPQSRFHPFRQTSTMMHQMFPVHSNPRYQIPGFESYAHWNSVYQNSFAVMANPESSTPSSQSSASTPTSQSSENHVKAEPASSQPARQSAGSDMNNEQFDVPNDNMFSSVYDHMIDPFEDFLHNRDLDPEDY
ncbi:hypothetical protein ACOSP7_012752 [Xanthoceras sorbifolium]